MGVLSIVSSRRSRASDSVAGGESKANGSIFGGSSSRMSAKQRRSMAALQAARNSSSLGGFVLSPQAAAAARRAASVRADAAALARAVRTDGATRAALCTLLLPSGKATATTAPADDASALGSPLDVEDFVRSSNGTEKCSGGVAALRRALQASRLDDPASFAGRYSLFMQWSPDGQHPWDSAQGADGPSATLELAILDDTIVADDDDVEIAPPVNFSSSGRRQVAAFLDGVAVEYEFADGVLRTKAPVPCAAPDGSVAAVHLQLQFSSGEPTWSTNGNKAQKHYAAPQCHGLLWFDASSGALPPADWPPAPPRVSGKANLVARPAARSPAGLPSLASFAGEYETLVLPPPTVNESGRIRRDGAPRKGLKLKISQDGKSVTLGGRQLKGVQFSRSSILSWRADGNSATPAGWVHCGHLAAGPLLLGRLEEEGSSSSPLFNLMAERAGSPSVFLTVDAIDTSAAALEAAGLAAAATAEVEAALASAEVAWSLTTNSSSAEGADAAPTADASSPAAVAAARAAAVAAVRRALAADAERELLVRAFGASAAGPGLVAMPDEASLGAASAQEEAAEHARAARHAADVAEAAAAVAAAEDGKASSSSSSSSSSSAGQQRRRPAAAAAKSATAAFNASRASASAAAAEAAASRAAGLARRTRMAGSRYVAALAASQFNLAALAARDATGAASDAAGAALSAARRHLAELALGDDYAAVRGAADAAEACQRARGLLAADATGAWAAGTARARALAPRLTAEAAEAAAEGARFLRELAAAASASEAAEGGEVFVPTTAAVNAAAAAKTEAAANAAAAAAAAAAAEAAVVVEEEEEEEAVVVAEEEVAAAVAAAADDA